MEKKYKIKDNQTGEILEIPESQLGQYGLSVPQVQPVQPTQIATQAATMEVPEDKSSFVGNVGSDIGENIQGLLSLPGLAVDLATGKAKGGEVGKAVVTGIIDEYKNLIKNPSKAFYERPVSSVLDILPFLAAGKLATAGRFGKAGTVAKTAETGVAKTALEESIGRDVTGAIEKTKAATVPKSSTASRVFSGQFTVPRKVASRLKPEQTAQELLDYGIKANNVDDYLRVSAELSGESGLFTNINRNALKYVGEVNYDNVMPSVRSFVDRQSTLTEKDIAGIRKFTPKKSGGKIGTANANDLWDSMKQLEDQGWQLINSSTDLSPNLRNEQLGKAYLAAADEIELSLNQAVKQSGTIDLFKNPEAMAFLNERSPKLAQKFQEAKTFEDIRNLQKPFVRLQRMAEITQAERSSPFAQLSRTMGRGRGLGIVSQIPGVGEIAGVGAEALKSPAAVASAKLLNSPTLGGSLQAAKKAVGKALSTTKGVAKQPISYIVGREIPKEAPSEAQPLETTEAADMALTQETQSPTSITGYSVEDLAKGYTQALLAGDTKAADRIKDLYDLESKYQESGVGGNIGKVSAQNYSNALSGSTSLDQIQPLLFNSSGQPRADVIAAIKTPGAPSQTARQAKALLYNIADSYLRLRTGAQANPTEIQKLADSLAPGILDDANTIKTKLQIYEQTFNQIIDTAKTGGIGEEPKNVNTGF